MTTFELEILITGLGMFVPRDDPKRMQVLFPKGPGSGSGKHHLYVAFEETTGTGLSGAKGDLKRFPLLGTTWVQVKANRTHNEIRSSLNETADIALDYTKILRVTDFANKLSAALVNTPLNEQRLNSSLLLSSGKAVHYDDWSWIRFELAEDPTPKPDRMATNAICWRISGCAPFLLDISGVKDRPQCLVEGGTGGGVTRMIIAHCPEKQQPAYWTDPANMPDLPTPSTPNGKRPDHFGHFYWMVGQNKPNPSLRKKGVPGGPVAIDRCFDRWPHAALVEPKGIHPIDCILTAGDPEPPGPLVRGRSDASDAHEHHEMLAINPHDRSRANVIA